MFTATFAAISALQVVRFGENQESVTVVIEIIWVQTLIFGQWAIIIIHIQI